MKTSELNRDIKRLWVACQNAHNPKDIEAHYKWVESHVKPEIVRLYHADTSMKSLNANSMRMLLRLNLIHRAIPLHQFGLHIS